MVLASDNVGLKPLHRQLSTSGAMISLLAFQNTFSKGNSASMVKRCSRRGTETLSVSLETKTFQFKYKMLRRRANIYLNVNHSKKLSLNNKWHRLNIYIEIILKYFSTERAAAFVIVCLIHKEQDIWLGSAITTFGCNIGLGNATDTKAKVEYSDHCSSRVPLHRPAPSRDPLQTGPRSQTALGGLDSSEGHVDGLTSLMGTYVVIRVLTAL